MSDSKPSMLERLAPKISVAHVSVDLAETNSLLRELVEAQLRSARAIEALVLHAFSVDLTVIPEVEPEGGRKLTDPELRDDDIGGLEEIMATVEILEQEGYAVPREVYERLGIDSPRKSDEPEPAQDDPEQFGGSDYDDHEPPTARKDL